MTVDINKYTKVRKKLQDLQADKTDLPSTI